MWCSGGKACWRHRHFTRGRRMVPANMTFEIWRNSRSKIRRRGWRKGKEQTTREWHIRLTENRGMISRKGNARRDIKYWVLSILTFQPHVVASSWINSGKLQANAKNAASDFIARAFFTRSLLTSMLPALLSRHMTLIATSVVLYTSIFLY